MPQAARRWADPSARPSVTLSVSASVPAEPAPSASPERVAAAARDGALVAQARAGDSSAFDALVRTYMEQAFRVAFRVVGHREDAEDLVQEAFLAAYQYLDSFEVGRPFGPWLMRIVVNRGANLRRSRARRSTEPETEGVSDAPSALEEADAVVVDPDAVVDDPTMIGPFVPEADGTAAWACETASPDGPPIP